MESGGVRKLFLDDVREPFDDSWWVVRNIGQFQSYVETKGIPEVVSFDHDLGPQHYEAYQYGFEYIDGTGYDCAKWLLKRIEDEALEFPKTVIVHSWNLMGAKKIAGVFAGQRVAVLVHPYPCTPLKLFIEHL